MFSFERDNENCGTKALLRDPILPDNFGYALLILGLALLLAPYFRGSDFGVVKVPEFEASTRTALRIIGPVAMLGAVLVHVDLLPLKAGIEPSKQSPKAGEPTSGRHDAALEPGSDVLAPRQGGSCLYAAKVLRIDGELATVRFGFGRDAQVPLEKVTAVRRTAPAADLGDKVPRLPRCRRRLGAWDG